MPSTAVPNGPPGRSPEALWHLVQSQMIKTFNRANENKDIRFKCWPLFQAAPPSEEHEWQYWMALVLTDAHETFPDAKDTCRVRIDETWMETTRVNNPVTSIRVENIDHRVFATYRIKVPRGLNNDRQLPWIPAEMTRDSKDGPLTPVFSSAKMLWVNIRLKVTMTPELVDQITYKRVPDASWTFHDPKHYHDIQLWGSEEDIEFQEAAIRKFNRTSVYPCWLVLCHPSDDELYQAGPNDTILQQCLVVMSASDLREAFPKVGDLCDLAFAADMPKLEDKDAGTTKDNLRLKRRGVKYFRGTHLDNPYDQFDLDGRSDYSLNWKDYYTFKIFVHRKPADDASDYTPFQGIDCKLDRTMISRQVGGSKPHIIIDKVSSLQAHVWLDISDTTISVERNALKTALKQRPDSRVGKALTYIRTFTNPADTFNLFRTFPHMKDPDSNSQLPGNLKALFRDLDHDQKDVYRSVLANLPCRIGIIPGGPGAGKTELMLKISALALVNHVPLEQVRSAANGEERSTGGPILLIVEANRPANVAANRVVEQFQTLGRTDLRILRAYNFNYEGKWGTRRYLQTDNNDETPPGFDFDECFPTHRADHIPQMRRGLRTDCLAPTLKEETQRYLAEHLDDFPLFEKLLTADPKKIRSSDDHVGDGHQKEWDALFSAVLARTDFVITTPVGAAKIAQYFSPKLVIFDDAARARELSTLVAIANYPSAEAWLFTGSVEMTRPYLSSWGNRSLWNPCADQLRTSMMERYSNVTPDTHRLSLNHQAHGNLHALSSDLFWGGQIDSALPSSERFPPSTLHLLELWRSLANNPTLTVPRLLVHVKSSSTVDVREKSKVNKKHVNWVLHRIVRNLVQDVKFRSIDGNEPGSVIITAPYKAQFTTYRREINSLMRELDREHRLAGGHGNRLHREVLVEARTADTVQGHSADVLIFDLVRSEITSHINDPNRMCVALTRAKQAEIILMEKSLLGQEGPKSERRRPDSSGLYVDFLYQYCASHGQVIEVDMVDESHVENDYTVYRANARSGRDPSAVPRQLPALPLTRDLPQHDERADASSAAVAPKLPVSESNDDGGDVESMFGHAGKFGFEMVRKAMELGLNLSAETDPSA